MNNPPVSAVPVPLNLSELLARLSRELKINPNGAARALELLDGGATIPFISRYRKEATGAINEDQLRQLEKGVAYARQLADQKATVWKSIFEQEKLTVDLAARLEKAATLQEIEDIYLPFRPRRRTRATIAREKGLEPLAAMILAGQTFRGQPADYALKFVDAGLGVASPAEALAGACDIVAEWVSEEAELRRRLRQAMRQQAIFVSKKAKTGQDEARKYEQYYEYSEPVARIPSHRRLALNRGEKEGILSVNLALPPGLAEKITESVFPIELRSVFRDQFKATLADSLKRLILPSLENEVRASLTEEAEAHAIRIFPANLRQLLLQPPIQGRVVLGLDPGFRTGCKVAVVDPTGKPLANGTIYPHEPKRDWEGSKKSLLAMIKRYGVSVIAIGNGTASRETETLVAELIAEAAEPRPAYVMVSEAGASVYSASELARQEFPDLDVTQRGNISIARRLQDPLAELVKVEPRSIGVGLYQHDVDQKSLSQTLDSVVESCVNYVGVDLNTASSSLLNYVSGINKKVAASIVAYRETNGPFKSRNDLRKVPGLGDKTYEQAAGFLKIPTGQNPLDNTFIHPESYPAATALLKLMSENQPKSGKLPPPTAIKEFRTQALTDDHKLASVAAQLGLGPLTLRDIMDNLEKPGRDPREELPKPLLRHDILKIDDLSPGMILTGTVRNVVDFGAFVDIGVKQDGLVHITEMSEQYVKHPLEVVNVGDVIEVRVLQIDQKRNRVSLSMKML